MATQAFVFLAQPLIFVAELVERSGTRGGRGPEPGFVGTHVHFLEVEAGAHGVEGSAGPIRMAGFRKPEDAALLHTTAGD